MAYYKSAFCTLSDVVKQYNLDDSPATSVTAATQAVIDAMDSVQRILLKQLIFDVSDQIMQEWDRSFVPYVATETIRPSMGAWVNWRYENGVLKYYLQDIAYGDLLELSSIEIDDTVLSSSYYRLEGQVPYDCITFDRSNTTLPSSSTFSSKVEIAGTWGYHENPSAMWSSIGTLQSALNDSATTFVATAGTVASFEIYQYLEIDSELLFVTDVLATAPYTITVERGVRGSTAASHLISATISAYQQMPDVIKATRRRVINLMQKKAELANLVQIGEIAVEASTENVDLNIAKRWTVRAV